MAEQRATAAQHMANADASPAGPSGSRSLPTAAKGHQDLADMETQDGASGLSTSDPSEEGLPQGTLQEDPYSNWTLNLSKRTKRRLAKGENATVGGITLTPPNTNPPPSSAQLRTSNAPSMKRRKLPPLPKGDFKIIMRPKKGLQVKNHTNHQVSRAVSQACGGTIEDSKYLVRLHPGSNIIILSTPHQEVAEVLRKITQVTLAGMKYLVNTYVATSTGSDLDSLKLQLTQYTCRICSYAVGPLVVCPQLDPTGVEGFTLPLASRDAAAALDVVQ